MIRKRNLCIVLSMMSFSLYALKHRVISNSLAIQFKQFEQIKHLSPEAIDNQLELLKNSNQELFSTLSAFSRIEFSKDQKEKATQLSTVLSCLNYTPITTLALATPQQKVVIPAIHSEPPSQLPSLMISPAEDSLKNSSEKQVQGYFDSKTISCLGLASGMIVCQVWYPEFLPSLFKDMWMMRRAYAHLLSWR